MRTEAEQAGPASPCYGSTLLISVGTENGLERALKGQERSLGQKIWRFWTACAAGPWGTGVNHCGKPAPRASGRQLQTGQRWGRDGNTGCCNIGPTTRCWVSTADFMFQCITGPLLVNGQRFPHVFCQGPVRFHAVSKKVLKNQMPVMAWSLTQSQTSWSVKSSGP